MSKRAGLLVLLLALGACAGYGPQQVRSGQSPEEVARAMGAPTARHTMPDGHQRLEYARGPHGKHTWMIDLDAQGRVATVTQVLTEANFNRIPVGMRRADLLATLGQPSARRPGGWQGGEIWAWRYDAVFCTWFMATVGDDGTVRDTGYGPDPACEDLTLP